VYRARSVKGAAAFDHRLAARAGLRHVRLILNCLNSRYLPLVFVFCFSKCIVILRGNFGHLGGPSKSR